MRSLGRLAARGRDALARFVPTLREWEYVPEGWERARRSSVRGWGESAVVDAYRAKALAFREAIDGPGPIAISTSAAFRDAPPSVKDQNIVLAYGYALALSSRDRQALSILDWGGGVGLFSLLSRALLPTEVELEYHCKDLPTLCAGGQQLMPEVQFHEDESCLERTYDLVVASSSLQYSEDWQDVLAGLARAAGGYLYLARVPVVQEHGSFVVLQRAERYGLGTEYLSWVFNRDELVEAASGVSMALVREFLFGERTRIHRAPERDETRGFLFRPARR